MKKLVLAYSVIFILITLACNRSEDELKPYVEGNNIAFPTIVLAYASAPADSFQLLVDSTHHFWGKNQKILAKLEKLRAENTLFTAENITSITNNGIQTVSFMKTIDDEAMLFILNFSGERQHIKLIVDKEHKDWIMAKYLNVFNSSIQHINSTIPVDPYGAMILLKIKSIQ
jgi:hypothetical protein